MRNFSGKKLPRDARVEENASEDGTVEESREETRVIDMKLGV